MMATSLIVNHPHPEKLDFSEAELTNFADNLLTECDKEKYTLSLVITTDEEICDLNLSYRGKDAPTNVLSFPFADGAEEVIESLPIFELGDVVISLDTAQKEAVEFEQSLSYRLAWLITHGLLHLLGMDHERSEKEAEEMYDKEQELLAKYYQDRRAE